MELDKFLRNECSVFKDILDKVDAGIMIVDTRGRVVYYNQVASSIDNLDSEDVIGNHISEVYPQIKESTLLQVQRTRQALVDEPQTYKTRHGKTVSILFSTYPLIFQGEIVGSVDISRDITQLKELSEQNTALRGKLLKSGDKDRSINHTEAKFSFEDIITADSSLTNLIKVAERISDSDSPVLIYGETGTGKELFAQAIHNSGSRKGHFIAQNCAALPGNLLESILFGTVKGSFTGSEDRQGLIELADKGTLFLDEINAIPLDLQAKLLRFLQEGSFRRVGDLKMRKVKVRVIASTNMEPEAAIEKKLLRSDLFYRLNAIYLELPPLRKRKDDIKLLASYFIAKFNKQMRLHIEGVEPGVLEVLEDYTWPGNVRELEHCIEHAMNIGLDKKITLRELPQNILRANQNREISTGTKLPGSNMEKMNLNEFLKETEKAVILEALKSSDGNISRASEKLGIPRQTLHYRTKVLGIPTHKAFMDA